MTDYPKTRTCEQVDDYHGTPVADPYRWLENPDSDETRAWIQAQNNLTFSFLETLPDRQHFRERLRDLWNFPKAGVPFKRSGRLFQFRNSGLQNHHVLYVSDDVGEGGLAEARALLDPNTFSETGTVALTSIAVSFDGRLLAYALSESGSDWLTWRVRNIDTGEDLADVVPWSKFAGAAWQPDGSGFYYQRFAEPSAGETYTQTNQAPQLRFHKLGTDPASDAVVFERPDEPEWGFGAQVTHDGRFLLLYVSQGTDPRNLLFYQRLGEDATFQPVADTFVADYTVIGSDGDTLFIFSDENAPKGSLRAFDTNTRTWSDILPEEARVLEGVTLVRDGFIVHYLQDASSRLEHVDRRGNNIAEIALPTLGSVTNVNAEPDEDEVYYGFTSFLYPTTSYRYDLVSQQSLELFRPEIDFDSSPLVTRQVFVTSPDGTKVPMFITHQRDIQDDGNNPTLLYGYGGFNVSLLPSFSVSRLAWLERGGILAVANLRGGGEYGETWHQAGTKAHKQNVFDDFIACAEHLIDSGLTSPAKLAIQGGSNGGLLVGAAMTQRPDLFAAALPAVGVMDMLRFHTFTIGWAWVSDYGCADNPEDFPVLYAYSPLHNLRATAYPATLITTADHDDRVVPAHSFKFAATLQAQQRGDAPVLIRIQTDAGHGAGKPTHMVIDEQADIWAFLSYVLAADVSVRKPASNPLAGEA